MKINNEVIEEFDKARRYLYITGYLTEKENQRIIKRFIKDAEKQGIILSVPPVFRSNLFQ